MVKEYFGVERKSVVRSRADEAHIAELKSALKAALEWIDAVPRDVVLPAMPGFDRDWVDGLLASPVEQTHPIEEQ